MVLVVALVLVGAAVGLMFVGRANTGNYILALLAILSTIGVFSLFALASGIIRFAGKDTGNPDDPRGGGQRLRRHCGDRCRRPRDVCERRLSGAGRCGRRERRAAGRARLHRRPGCVGGGLSPAESVARRPPPAGRGAGRGLQRQGSALAAHARAPAGGRKESRAAPPSGASPMSRATARNRKTSSRNCSTRSTISITRRPDSSRSMARARWSISTRRSRPGSITIWRPWAPAA